MHQNRVDPMGALHAVPQRGAWMGNRGCLHDDRGTIRRGWQVRRWITCLTAFKNRRRAIMQPGLYTELFFFDEATAYAAGHRPCAECRRADYNRFMALWRAHIGPAQTVEDVDHVLHAARLNGKARRVFTAEAATAPIGAMIDLAGPVIRGAKGWHRWSFDGYAPLSAPSGPVTVLTPEPFVRLMRAGLSVQIGANDPSASRDKGIPTCTAPHSR